MERTIFGVYVRISTIWLCPTRATRELMLERIIKHDGRGLPQLWPAFVCRLAYHVQQADICRVVRLGFIELAWVRRSKKPYRADGPLTFEAG